MSDSEDNEEYPPEEVEEVDHTEDDEYEIYQSDHSQCDEDEDENQLDDIRAFSSLANRTTTVAIKKLKIVLNQFDTDTKKWHLVFSDKQMNMLRESKRLLASVVTENDDIDVSTKVNIVCNIYKFVY